MIIFWYIASCIAGAIIIGTPAPSPIDRTEVTGVSSIPFANLPMVFAVHGYTMIRSDVSKLASPYMFQISRKFGYYRISTGPQKIFFIDEFFNRF